MSEDEIWGYSSSTSYTITVYPNKWFDHYFYPSSSPVPTPKPSQTIAPNSSFLQLQNPPNTLLSHPLCCCCCCYLVSCKKRSLFNLHSKTVAYKMCVCVYLSLHILHYLIALPISLDELEQEKHPVRPSIHPQTFVLWFDHISIVYKSKWVKESNFNHSLNRSHLLSHSIICFLMYSYFRHLIVNLLLLPLHHPAFLSSPVPIKLIIHSLCHSSSWTWW